MAQEYIRPIKYVFLLFLFNQMLAAFLRNDDNPGLATIAVLLGGIFIFLEIPVIRLLKDTRREAIMQQNIIMKMQQSKKL